MKSGMWKPRCNRGSRTNGQPTARLFHTTHRCAAEAFQKAIAIISALTAFTSGALSGADVLSLSSIGGEEVVCRSGRDLATAFATGTVSKIRVPVDIIVHDDDWRDLPSPVLVTRNLTILGDAAEWPLLDFNYVKAKVQLGNGVVLTMEGLVTDGMRAGPMSVAPGMDLLLPLPEGQQAVVVGKEGLRLGRACYPPEYRDAAAQSSRPVWLPGSNTLITSLPQTGCVNSSAVPPQQRCWAGRGWFIDLALECFDLDKASGTRVRLNYALWALNQGFACRWLLSPDCIRQYGPVGCLLLVDRSIGAAVSSPPSMLSPGALDAANGAGGDGGPAASRYSSPADSSPSSPPGSSVAVVLAAVLGSVGGAALLAILGLVVALVVRRRRQQMRGVKEAADQPASENANEARPSSLCGGCSSLRWLHRHPSDVTATATATNALIRGSTFSVEIGGGGAMSTVVNTGQCEVALAQASKTPVCACSDRTGTATSGGETPSETTGASAGHGSSAAMPPLPPAASPQPVSTDLAAAAAAAAAAVTATTTTTAEQVLLQVPPLQPIEDAAVVVPGSGADAAAPAAAAASGGMHDNVLRLEGVTLGKGTHGRCVVGTYNGERVAVKLIWGGGLVEPDDKQLAVMQQEVQVLGRCRHPNVVRLLAATMAPPRPCLVMELMETNLERLLYGEASTAPAEKPLPLDKVLHLAQDIALGLEFLHPRIVHRDIKPSNVLINGAASNRPMAKLADFGVARLLGSTRETKTPEAGTPPYMAPECFDANNYVITHKADIYAFGVLLAEMLSGLRPWPGLDILTIACQVTLHKSRPPLLEGLPESRCPPKLRKLIYGCWEQDPRRRPAAAEVVKALVMVQQQLKNQQELQYLAWSSAGSQKTMTAAAAAATATVVGGSGSGTGTSTTQNNNTDAVGGNA